MIQWIGLEISVEYILKVYINCTLNNKIYILISKCFSIILYFATIITICLSRTLTNAKNINKYYINSIIFIYRFIALSHNSLKKLIRFYVVNIIIV